MSLILEALKKAERQHKLGEVPGLGSSQIPEQRPGPRWLGLLLLVAVAGGMLTLGVYLGGGDGDQGPRGTAREVELHPPAAMPSETASLDRRPVADRPSKPEPQPATAADKRAAVPPVVGKAKPRQEVIPRVLQPEPSPVVFETVPDPTPEVPRRLSELPTGFVDRLPKLNIDIHSYDKEGKRSYVLINLEKYREGDYLAEGPLLSEIRPDGVVLEHMGERFILPIGNR